MKILVVIYFAFICLFASDMAFAGGKGKFIGRVYRAVEKGIKYSPEELWRAHKISKIVSKEIELATAASAYQIPQTTLLPQMPLAKISFSPARMTTEALEDFLPSWKTSLTYDFSASQIRVIETTLAHLDEVFFRRVGQEQILILENAEWNYKGFFKPFLLHQAQEHGVTFSPDQLDYLCGKSSIKTGFSLDNYLTLATAEAFVLQHGFFPRRAFYFQGRELLLEELPSSYQQEVKLFRSIEKALSNGAGRDPVLIRLSLLKQKTLPVLNLPVLPKKLTH